MPPRSGPIDVSNDMILGELRGQVRELVHSVNNLNSKFDGLTREVIALGPLAVQIAENRVEIAKLKEIYQQQAGAKNLATWILQSPLVGWIAAALMFFAVMWTKIK